MITTNKFVKLVDEHYVDYAPYTIKVGDTTIINPTPEQYAELGFYELYTNFEYDKEGKEVEPPKWYRYINHYELQEVDKKEEKKGEEDSGDDEPVALPIIVQTHQLEKLPCPDYAHEVSRLVRSRYSQNDVEAIILNYMNSAKASQEEFDELQSYRATCKQEAQAEIDEWEKA